MNSLLPIEAQGVVEYYLTEDVQMNYVAMGSFSFIGHSAHITCPFIWERSCGKQAPWIRIKLYNISRINLYSNRFIFQVITDHYKMTDIFRSLRSLWSKSTWNTDIWRARGYYITPRLQHDDDDEDEDDDDGDYDYI